MKKILTEPLVHFLVIGAEGSFSVGETDKTGRDNRAKGMLLYDGTRYLKYAETREIMLKVGKLDL